MGDDLKVQFESLVKTIPPDRLPEFIQWMSGYHSEIQPEKVQPETLRLVYKEYGDQIRHFSTVRSALTTFLLTVSLGSFAAYFNKSQMHPFLIAAGLIFLFAAVFTCLTFSFRTEKAVIRFKAIWKYLNHEKQINCNKLPIHDPRWTEIWGRVFWDQMNWLIMIAAIVIILAFWGRDRLGSILGSVGLL